MRLSESIFPICTLFVVATAAIPIPDHYSDAHSTVTTLYRRTDNGSGAVNIVCAFDHHSNESNTEPLKVAFLGAADDLHMSQKYFWATEACKKRKRYLAAYDSVTISLGNAKKAHMAFYQSHEPFVEGASEVVECLPTLPSQGTSPSQCTSPSQGTLPKLEVKFWEGVPDNQRTALEKKAIEHRKKDPRLAKYNSVTISLALGMKARLTFRKADGEVTVYVMYRPPAA